MTQQSPRTYAGIPIYVIEPRLLRKVATIGRLLFKTDRYAAYQHGNRVYFVPSDAQSTAVGERSDGRGNG